MKILITGANGQLGKEFSYNLQSSKYEVFSYSSREIDIRDIDNVKHYILKIKPQILINCAAYTDVDGCESNIEKAFQVNALGVKNLAILADRFDIKLIHFSTDYVFDGDSFVPYNEYDAVNPISIYGKSKYYGELLIKQHCNNFFIFRIAGVYGINGKNFVKTIVNLGIKSDKVKVVNDQITAPTFTLDIVNQVKKIINTEHFGLYHCTSSGQCSWFEFTKHIYKKLNIQTELTPCSSFEFPRPAQRPKFSVLDNFNLRLLNLDVMRDWKEAIDDFLEIYGEDICR